MHPLYYDYPEAPEAYSNKDEYAFGDSMIVAPVVRPVDAETQLAKQSIWIPKGDWIEWPSGKHLSGPAAVDRSFSISQEPVYLRAGSIIPMQPPMQYTGQKPVDPLILNIWPLADGQSSAYTLYEDGSDGESYKHGVYALTPISAVQKGDTLTVDIASVQGGYPGMPASRGYELRLIADWPPESVTADGISLAFQSTDPTASGWSYDGNTLSTIIRIPSQSVGKVVHIVIRRSPGSLATRGQLDGFSGAIARLHSSYDVLNQQWPFAWSPDPLIDAWQTGDRISYRPLTARDELTQFARKYATAETSVQQLLDAVASMSNEQLTEQLVKYHGGKTVSVRAQHYRESLQRALDQLKDGRPN